MYEWRDKAVPVFYQGCCYRSMLMLKLNKSKKIYDGIRSIVESFENRSIKQQWKKMAWAY